MCYKRIINQGNLSMSGHLDAARTHARIKKQEEDAHSHYQGIDWAEHLPFVEVIVDDVLGRPGEHNVAQIYLPRIKGDA